MSKINIKPIAGTNNRVVVLPTAAEETTVSGIIIPDSAQEKPQKGAWIGTILAIVGSGLIFIY